MIRPPVRKEIRAGQRLAKSLAGETTLAATLVVRVGDQQGEQRDAGSPAGCRSRDEQDHRIPDRLAEDDHRGRGHGDADEGEQRHRRRQAEHLAADLGALALARSAMKSGMFSARVAQKPTMRGERRDEEAQELAGRLKFARLRSSTGPKPPASLVTHQSSRRPTASRNGAAQMPRAA